MVTQRPIVHLFGDAVKHAETAILPYLKQQNPETQQLHYLYGHPVAILEKLQQMMQPQAEQYKRFPLVALFQDFREATGAKVGIRADARLRCIIACPTKPEYDTPTRYATNFLPVLYPIYEQLLKSLPASGGFFLQAPSQIQHTKTDRPFWGKEGLYGNTGNVFNDALDCIEITDLQLRVKRPFCTAPSGGFAFKNF